MAIPREKQSWRAASLRHNSLASASPSMVGIREVRINRSNVRAALG